MIDKRLNYEKEIADMEALIATLAGLAQVKMMLVSEYQKEAVRTDTPATQIESLEYMAKCHNAQIEVFQLEAEIQQKRKILPELKSRAEENDKNTEVLIKLAMSDLESQIETAKKLADNPRLNKKLRKDLESAFLLPYRTRYKLSGFGDDEKMAAFYKGLTQLIADCEKNVTR